MSQNLPKGAGDRAGQESVEGLRVFVFVQRLWGVRIGHYIATQLVNKGARVSAFVEKKATMEFVKTQCDVEYEEILSYENIMNDPHAFIDEDVTLDEICNDLGIDSIWPLATTEHDLARCYSGKFFYEDVQNKDDDFIIAYVKAMYCQIRRLFVAFDPDVVITPNFVAPHHLIVELMAKRRGIRMIGVSGTWVDGIFSFCYDYKVCEGPVIERVRRLQARELVSPNAQKARDYIEEYRKNYSQPLYQARIDDILKKSHLLRELKQACIASARYLLRGGVNPMPNIGTTPDNRSPWYLFRDVLMEWKYRREAARFEYTPLEEIGRFAYFPFQMQPEALIDTIAGHFSNQVEVARLTAKSLPGDMSLVVKEHPSMLGKRGRKFYEKLARTPNIKVVDYRLTPSELLKRCELIVSPGGTTLAEGAYFGKHAIQFSEIGVTQLLPNVFKQSDLSKLPSRIREILSTPLGGEEYEFQLECFVAGAFDLGFEIDYVGLWVYGYEINLSQLYDQFEKVILESCRETGRLKNINENYANASAS